MASNIALKKEMTEGLGSFALGEADTEAYFAEEVDSGGIADLGAIRERMAKAGRFDDDHVGHLATGELVVPAPLLEKLPELRESILGHLREMGVEDPERYIVGNKLNSVNPETGMVEFGFFSSIKKAFKSVGKFLKKAAPTIIKIAGTALLASTGIGLPLAAAISSGIGTLVGGGSLTDALKSAAIGGATGYLAGPLGEVASNALGGAAQAAVAGGDASDILKGAGLGAAGAAAGKLLTPSLSDTALGRTLGMKPGTSLSEDLSKTGEFFGVSDAAAAGTGAGMGIDTTSSSPAASLDASAIGDMYTPAASLDASAIGDMYMPAANLDASAIGDMYTPGTGAPAYEFTDADFGGTGTPALTAQDLSPGPLDQASDYLQQAYDYATTSDPRFDADDVFLNKPNVPPEAAQRYAELVAKGMPAPNAAKSVAEKYAPGFFGANRPYILAGGVGLAAATPFLMETPEMEKPDVLSDPRAAGPSEELINQYRLGRESLFPGVTPAAERQTMVATGPTSYGYSQYLRQQYPELFAADGGGVFPRRTGGIMPDEGIPGKDSVKALVMPGEFIFTTDAVRGAGNGNLRQGINNMYNVMRNLEARGKRMA